MSHLSLREVYRDFTHHKYGTHLAGGVLDNVICQIYWCWLAAQSAIWYSTPPCKVRRRFTAVLAAEWRGVLNDKWNSDKPIVFSYVVLTRTLGDCKAREIRARIDRQLNFWERGIHAGLVGNALVEGRSREGCVKKSEK